MKSKYFTIPLRKNFLTICEQQIRDTGKREGLAELDQILKPKAIMLGEIFPERTGYRITTDIARHILSLDSNGNQLPQPNASANHCVSFLPQPDKNDAKVYFKANGIPALQPGKEAMLYSLYKLLNIPLPHTGLLVITRVRLNDPTFYAVQASEAVIGNSPNLDVAFEDKLQPETKGFALHAFANRH